MVAVYPLPTIPPAARPFADVEVLVAVMFPLFIHPSIFPAARPEIPPISGVPPELYTLPLFIQFVAPPSPVIPPIFHALL